MARARMIHFLGIDDCQAQATGHKAARLSRLRAIGFPVPPGLVVTTAVFRQALAPYWTTIQTLLADANLAALPQAEAAAAAIRGLLADLTLPATIQPALEQAVADLQATRFAVRSSAVGEDGAKTSFAGLYQTTLGVSTLAEITAAILDGWRSYFAPQALSARAQKPGQADGGMAVLIQPLLAADCAGVAFSLDPVQQSRDQLLINAVWGLGSGVVEGSLPSDTAWVRRHPLRVDRHEVVEKSEQMTIGANGRLTRAPVSPEQRRAACLPPAWLTRIAQFALAAEQWLGLPQEIEWAITGSQLWFLQSRPITGLPPELTQSPPFPVSWTDEAESRQLWELSHLSEPGETLLPLERAYTEAVEATRVETCCWLGVERNWARKWVNGRAYAHSIPVGLPAADMAVRRAAYQDLQERWRQQEQTSWDYWGPEVIRATERLRAFVIEAADNAALANHLEEAVAVARRHTMLHPMMTFRPPNAYYDAFRAVSGLSGAAAQTEAHWLLEGEATPLTRLIDGLYSLAQTARPHPAVTALVAATLPATSPPDVMAQLARLPEAADFRRQLDEFLAVYGERTGNGYGSHANLSVPTWRERPELALRLVAPYLDPAVTPPPVVRARAEQARQARVAALCAAEDEAAATFQRELAYARRVFSVLEEHNHYLDQMGLGQTRQAVMAAAVRLVEAKVLTAAEEVLWLTFDEILAALRAERPSSLAPLIAERRAQDAVWRQAEAPPILGVPPADLGERPPLTDDVEPTAVSLPGQINGLGASPGQVTGRARVILGGDSLSTLSPGDILVTHNVGPRWTPLLPILGGLVLDSGSVGQHAAATAREYGLPAVIATGNATQRVNDGDWLTVDGTAGTVLTSGCASC